VRRFLTALIIAAMTLPSLALMSAEARAACCCQSSGSCPLRKHAGCEMTCSMERSDASPASSFRALDLGRDRAVFLATSPLFATSSTDFVADFSAVALHRAIPPILPPPRS
jgi:hypothetical protein